MREINKIVVHCTDSDDSLDIGVKEIRRWHQQRGWSDVGYHYIIRRDGRLERGRHDEIMGAHVKGHNSDSIGIVWAGRRVASTEQLLTLYGLLRGLMAKYDLQVFDIYGHTELDSKKTCPNLDMVFVRAQVLFHTGDINVDEI
jgi:N-acetylmuramoyl-L-alanine amidase